MNETDLTPRQRANLKARMAAWRKADDAKAEKLRARGWVCVPPDEIEALTPPQAHMLVASLAGLGPDKPCAARPGKNHDHRICTIAAEEWTP